MNHPNGAAIVSFFCLKASNCPPLSLGPSPDSLAWNRRPLFIQQKCTEFLPRSRQVKAEKDEQMYPPRQCSGPLSEEGFRSFCQRHQPPKESQEKSPVAGSYSTQPLNTASQTGRESQSWFLGLQTPLWQLSQE